MMNFKYCDRCGCFMRCVLTPYDVHWVCAPCGYDSRDVRIFASNKTILKEVTND